VGAIVVVLAIAGAIGSNTPKTVRKAGKPSATSSSTTPQSSTPTTSEEEDLSGAGAPTIAGTVVSSGAGASTGATACRTGSPLANVYHPNRLTVVSACMTVSGTVESVRSERDGDTHFDLALDAQFSSLLKPGNFSDQHGWLVAEVVPADKPGCTPGQPPRPATGSYDYGMCSGADEVTPAIGSHVYVTGPYVLDEDHGGWAEVHPVWAVSTHAPAPGSSQASPPSTAATAPPTTAEARPPPPSAASGVRIESVTSPVARGSEASLVAQTSPNAACDLEVTLPSGAKSQSQGLGPAESDSTGRVAWDWKIGTRTSPGTATATVTCSSATASAQFQITS
jgi:hypothetical protein